MRISFLLLWLPCGGIGGLVMGWDGIVTRQPGPLPQAGGWTHRGSLVHLVNSVKNVTCVQKNRQVMQFFFAVSRVNY